MKEYTKANARLSSTGPEKRCKDCLVWFPATQETFNLSPSGKFCLNQRCRDCQAVFQRQRYVANLEARRLVAKERNRKKRTEKNRLRKARKTYELKHPKAKALENIRYRDRQKGLTTDFGVVDWKRCLESWGRSCAYCGHHFKFNEAIHVEHYIPVARGDDCPGTVATNILPACAKCNMSKRDRDPVEWLTRKFGVVGASHVIKRIQDYFTSISTAESKGGGE